VGAISTAPWLSADRRIVAGDGGFGVLLPRF